MIGNDIKDDDYINIIRWYIRDNAIDELELFLVVIYDYIQLNQTLLDPVLLYCCIHGTNDMMKTMLKHTHTFDPIRKTALLDGWWYLRYNAIHCALFFDNVKKVKVLLKDERVLNKVIYMDNIIINAI